MWRRLKTGTGMSEQTVLLVLAVATGLGGGMGAVIFRKLIDWFEWFFFTWLKGPFVFLGDNYVIVLPAIGGLIVGPIIVYFAREAKGHGVPEVMEAIVRKGGAIRPQVSLIKAIASSITIGSGGSAGREGPMVQIGSGLGSTLGQVLKLKKSHVRSLVACGAAAGIAATFNAPLAGAFFAFEIILVEWGVESFAPVVVASVASSVVGKIYFGDHPAFQIPQYSLAAFTELPLFLVFGALCAGVGLSFVRTLYLSEDFWERVPAPEYLLPALGGLAVGLVGRFAPEAFGVGYPTIQRMLTGASVGLIFPLLMLLAKMWTTDMTLGSGASGGVFAPSLFMGAMAGAAFGNLVHSVFPSATTSPGAYALVGMAAAFSAASHAPITSVLIVFELTMDYRMILPLMLACGVSTAIARLAFRFSIYNLKLVRRGIHVSLREDPALLNTITVGEAMTTDLITVLPDMPVKKLAEAFDRSKHHGFPVVDAKGSFHGLVTISDVRRGLGKGLADATVADIATHDVIVAYPNENLNDALRKLGLRDVGRLPVVDREDHSRLLGLITRKNVIAAYNRAMVAQHTRLEDTLDIEHFD